MGFAGNPNDYSCSPPKCFTPYQATTLLTAVGPVVPAAVELVPSLVEALAGDTGVTLRAAEEIGAGVLAVTGCSPAENLPILQGHIALMSTTNHQTAPSDVQVGPFNFVGVRCSKITVALIVLYCELTTGSIPHLNL